MIFFNYEVYKCARPPLVQQKIERLQRKYKNLDLRTLNISEYREYQKVKSMETQKYQYLMPVPPVIQLIP